MADVFANFAPPHCPFGLSLPFDRLRMIGNTNRSNTNPLPFGLSLSKPRRTPEFPIILSLSKDKLSANGVWGVFDVPRIAMS
jgi:hypothetical protein